ncbi:MAG: hypothetical protein ACM3JD_14030, partial [Rudaea sp.]
MSTPLNFWIGFNLVPQIGPAKFQRLLDYFGDLETAWNADAFDLVRAGLDKRALENLLSARKSLDLNKEIAKAQGVCDKILTWDDPDYPHRLRQIPHAPPVLYIKGQITP